MDEVKVKKVSDNRFRNWTFILYPDECFKNWESVLQELKIECAVSPLHSPENEKKHYHVVIKGDKKTKEQIKESICAKLGEVVEIDGKKSIKGVAMPENVLNLRSNIRYLIHLDNPDKEQFEEKENAIKTFGGFDISRFFKEEKKVESSEKIRYIVGVIRNQKIGSMIELTNFLLDNERFDEVEYLASRSYFFNLLISDQRNKII